MIPDADCWLKGGGGGWGGRQHLLKGGGLIKGVLNKLAQHWVKIKELMTHKRTLQARGTTGTRWKRKNYPVLIPL